MTQSSHIFHVAALLTHLRQRHRWLRRFGSELKFFNK